MQFLEARYTEVWVPSAVAPLVRFADRVDRISSTGIDLFAVGDRASDKLLLKRLREFDSIVSWYGANRDEFRTETARHGFPFHFCSALPPPGNQNHAIDFFAAQVGAPIGLAPTLKAGDVERRASIVIHPFSGGTRKNWPLENFRELARALPLEVEWLAGPDDPMPEAQRFGDLWQVARWIAGARLYIGNDSGITHLAAATGTQVIALFGATNPEIWGPRGHKVTIMRSEPIRDLAVSGILREVRRVLGCA